MNLPPHTNYAMNDDAPGSVEGFIVGMVFLFASGIFNPSLVPPLGIFKINDFFIGLLAGAGCILLFTRFRDRLLWIDHRRLFMVILFYGFVGLSLLWTFSPLAAGARYFGFLIISVWTVYLAVRFDVRQTLRIMIKMLLVVAVISAVIALIAPRIGQMPHYPHAGDWMGIYGQKNTLGRQMAQLVILSLFCAIYYRPKAMYVAGIIIGALVLSQTGSRTAYALTAIGVLSLSILTLRRRPWVIVVGVLLTMFVVLLVSLKVLIDGKPAVVVDGEMIIVFGFPITLMGRMGLWDFALEWIGERIWFGFGYDGFWDLEEVIMFLEVAGGWSAADSHNGLVDLVLQLGVVGVVFFFVMYVPFLAVAVRRLVDIDVRTADLFPAFMLLFFIPVNLTESYLLKATNVIQLLFTYCLIRVSMIRIPDLVEDRAEEPVEPTPQKDPTLRHNGYFRF